MEEICFFLYTFPDFLKMIHKNQWRHWFLIIINEIQMKKKNKKKKKKKKKHNKISITLQILGLPQGGFHHWTRQPRVFLFSIYSTKSEMCLL